MADLIHHATPWLRTAIVITATLGMRRGDMLRLSPEHVDTINERISIAMNKTGHPLTLPLPSALRDELRRNPATPGTPFVAAMAGKPVTHAMLHKAWKRLKKKLGIDANLHMKDLRRTVANRAYEATKDLRIAQAILGHQSLTTTTLYIAPSDPATLRPILAELWTPKGPVQ